MAIDSSKCCLLRSLALNSCMILGYKVENIITALYFQCELSYIWGRKNLYFRYIGLFFFSLLSLQLLLIWAAQKGPHILSAVKLHSTERASGAFFPPCHSHCGVSGHGASGALFVGWCRAVLKSHRTDQQDTAVPSIVPEKVEVARLCNSLTQETSTPFPIKKAANEKQKGKSLLYQAQ